MDKGIRSCAPIECLIKLTTQYRRCTWGPNCLGLF